MELIEMLRRKIITYKEAMEIVRDRTKEIRKYNPVRNNEVAVIKKPELSESIQQKIEWFNN